MLKKILLAALACALLLPVAAAGLAETAPGKLLQGLITEVGDGYFVMNDEAIGPVRVNLDDAQTTYEGIAAKDTLAVGQYVLVTYNGAMTRSIPPQVTAQKVSCFVLSGVVTEILQNGYVVEGDSVIDRAIVHMGEGLAPVYLNMQVTVYYSGVMALSMPPQINALYVVVPTLAGTATGISDSGFTLTTAAGETYAVVQDGQTIRSVLLAEGLPVRVVYSGTLRADGAVLALEVTADAADPATVAQASGV